MHSRHVDPRLARRRASGAIAFLFVSLLSCAGAEAAANDPPAIEGASEVGPQSASTGQQIFRFDTFGDEKFWTDTLQMHHVIQKAVTPAVALSVGLKVDLDALPASLVEQLKLNKVDLNSTATTLALLKLNAVVGVKGQVQRVGGRDSLVRVGITCALCHSTVDNALIPGIGHRLDGWANVQLNPGAIIALSPALTPAQKAVYNSWGAGRYDPRFNIDGKNTPIVIPPAYGLRHVARETFTGDGPVSYWNGYVAVTQMHGQGTFKDDRLGIDIVQTPDLVTPKLAALREYQFSLSKPAPPAGSFDPVASRRGRAVFEGVARCATCHTGALLTDINAGVRHQPAETQMDPRYAARTVSRGYRTTPLRALFQHAPYFHDGSAARLADVVAHYERVLSLTLTASQRRDLLEYLKSL